MAYRRRRFYVPMTRSGSSILASLITQMIDEASRQRDHTIDQKLARGEITPTDAFFGKHPVFCIMIPMIGLFLIFAIISAVFK
jgi:hypothetical protein